MSTVGDPRLIPTVTGGSSRPNKTSSVKKSKFSELLLKPFCQITADLPNRSIPLFQTLRSMMKMVNTGVLGWQKVTRYASLIRLDDHQKMKHCLNTLEIL